MSRSSRSTNRRPVENSRDGFPYVVRDIDEDDELEQVNSGNSNPPGNLVNAPGNYVTETTVPNFLLKLWRLVEDEDYNYCISWDPSGSSFHVWEPYTFSKDVLPLFFKHSNLNSFIRQLNMYGFRKVSNLEQGALKHPANESDTLEFHHQYFIRGRPDLLPFIKRKTSSTRGASADLMDNRQLDLGVRNVNQAMDEIRMLREKQMGMDVKLSQMKRENETLWREIANLRQLHLKQEQVVSKMLQFLMTFVRPAGGGRISKRKILAIGSGQAIEDDSDPPRIKRVRSNAADIIEGLERELKNSTPPMVGNSTDPGSSRLVRVNGPTVADVTDQVEEMDGTNGGTLENVLMPNYTMPTTVTTTGMMQESPAMNEPSVSPNFVQTIYGASGQQQSPINDIAGTSTISPNIIDYDLVLTMPEKSDANFLPEFTGYLDGVQYDLDTLKDFLVSEGVQLDPSTLNDTLQSSGNGLMDFSGAMRQGDIVGNELQVYKPPELLVDLDSGADNSNGMESGPAVDSNLFDHTSMLTTPTTADVMEFPSGSSVAPTVGQQQIQGKRTNTVKGKGGRR